MSVKMTDRRVVWLALIGAHIEAETICEAYYYRDDEPTVQEYKKRQKAFDRVALKYYGRTITEALNNIPTKGAPRVPITEIWNTRESNPVLQDDAKHPQNQEPSD